MPKSRLHLRVPRRAIDQWLCVRAKLAKQIEARGQEADGASIFCEACAVLDAATDGPGIVAQPYQAAFAPRFAELIPPSDDPRRKIADKLDLVVQLRMIADRLEREMAEQEKPAGCEPAGFSSVTNPTTLSLTRKEEADDNSST